MGAKGIGNRKKPTINSKMQMTTPKRAEMKSVLRVIGMSRFSRKTEAYAMGIMPLTTQPPNATNKKGQKS
jgi:hypothetical protein